MVNSKEVSKIPDTNLEEVEVEELMTRLQNSMAQEKSGIIDGLDNKNLGEFIEGRFKNQNGKWKAYGDMVKDGLYTYCVQAAINNISNLDTLKNENILLDGESEDSGKTFKKHLEFKGGIDGQYGGGTKKIIKAFQKLLRINVDGQTGGQTFAHMCALLKGEKLDTEEAIQVEGYDENTPYAYNTISDTTAYIPKPTEKVDVVEENNQKNNKISDNKNNVKDKNETTELNKKEGEKIIKLMTKKEQNIIKSLKLKYEKSEYKQVNLLGAPSLIRYFTRKGKDGVYHFETERQKRGKRHLFFDSNNNNQYYIGKSSNKEIWLKEDEFKLADKLNLDRIENKEFTRKKYDGTYCFEEDGLHYRGDHFKGKQYIAKTDYNNKDEIRKKIETNASSA